MDPDLSTWTDEELANRMVARRFGEQLVAAEVARRAPEPEAPADPAPAADSASAGGDGSEIPPPVEPSQDQVLAEGEQPA